MSAGKKAKANFEKTAKKKPDTAGLAIGKAAQAALVQKDYSKAKELFENARTICEAFAVRATKAAKSVRKTNYGGENLALLTSASLSAFLCSAGSGCQTAWFSAMLHSEKLPPCSCSCHVARRWCLLLSDPVGVRANYCRANRDLSMAANWSKGQA